MKIFLRFKDKYEDYFAYMAKKGLKKKTIAERRQMLCEFFPQEFQNMRLATIKKSDTAMLEDVGALHGDWGRTRAIVALRRYFDYLQSECQIKLPLDWRDVKVPTGKIREQPVFEDYELATLFNVMETMEAGSVHGRRMAWTMEAYFETLFGTGLRMHEALGLKREQFAEIKDSAKVVVHRKGNEEVEVKFSDRSIEKLEKYLNRRNDTDEAMFVNSCGERLIEPTLKSYMQRLRRKLKSVGYPEISNKLRTHTFRRSLATYLLENGADLKVVQDVMNHKSARTTMKYYIRVNKRRAQIIHRSILSQIPFQVLAARYKNEGGRAMVRTTPNGGRWMHLDEQTTNQLAEIMKREPLAVSGK